MTNKGEVIRYDDGSIFLKFKKRSKARSKVARAFDCETCMDVKKLEESFTCQAQDGTKGEHTFCFECIKGYVASVLTPDSMGAHPNGIKCMTTCGNYIPYEVLQKKLKNMGPNMEDDLSSKLAHMSLIREGYTTINCPDCDFTLDITDYPLGVVIIHCDRCQYDFCRKCLHEMDEEHLEGICPSDVLLAADEDDTHRRRLLMQREIDELNLRKCPNCNVVTIRDDGSLHMNCSRCNVYWCYYCFRTLRGDDIYAYFCNCVAAPLGGICNICGSHRTFMTNEDIERIEAPLIREIKERYGFPEEIEENQEDDWVITDKFILRECLFK